MPKSQNVPLGSIRLKDCFFAPRIQINHASTIPANIAKCRETGRIDAFKLNWKEGMPNKPHIYWDSDVAKVLEGMAYDLILNPDSAREKELDEIVNLICSSQQPDGYLNSYFTAIEPDKRWVNIDYDHELYCAGHLIEAAVAYFQATGKRNFLNVMCKYADLIQSVFGKEEGKIPGYPGHEELELALCKLADATGEQKYADLAKYFVDERGQEPNYFTQVVLQRDPQRELFLEYWRSFQADRPVREQPEAEGHAVRAVYLYSGMADAYVRTGDPSLLDVCKRLWDDIVQRKMYITGNIGSDKSGERFTSDYDLPDDTAYAESCASMGLAFFTERMLNITGERKYADVLEQILYNGGMSGISLNGAEFFYCNPQVITEIPNRDTNHGHVRNERQKWFDCSCCPTNFCRFIPQVGRWICSTSGNELRIHIPAASSGKVMLKNGCFGFEITGGYPFDGKIALTVTEAPAAPCTLSFRIPGWCKEYSFGKETPETVNNGYASFTRCWKKGDTVTLDLTMNVRLMRPNAHIEANAGKAAFCRGPVVYAFEGIDNGAYLSRLIIPGKQDFRVEKSADWEGIYVLRGQAFRETIPDTDSLYSEAVPVQEPAAFTAVPYALWGNRGTGSMRIWMRIC